MHNKNKGKHVSKLKYIRIGDLSKDSEEVRKMPTVIDAEEDQDLDSNSYIQPEENFDSSKSEIKPEANIEHLSENYTDTPAYPPQTKHFAHLTGDSDGLSANTKSFSLPPFLNKMFLNDSNTTKSDKIEQLHTNHSDQKPLTSGDISNPNQDNPNSFSSIFNKDHEEIFGIQRVFRKSLIFLILNILTFGLLTFASLNFFSFSVMFIFVALLYVAVSNIFYIIVADRSYVWIAILGQIITLLIFHAFLGLSFDKITLVFTAGIAIFLYLSYSELEKIQLSSRLFSISHITNESTRVLTTVVLLVTALGVFNKIVNQGPQVFLTQAFLDKTVIMDNVIIGKSPNFSVNRFLMKGKFFLENSLVKQNTTNNNGDTIKANLTFGGFLTQNFKPGSSVITDERKQEIVASCGKKISTQACNSLVQDEMNKNLESWRAEAYSGLPYLLDTELNLEKFQKITRQYYINEISGFDKNNESSRSNDLIDTFSKLIILPRNYIFPAIISLIVFLLLLIIKPILNWLSFIVTWILWNMLKWTGFSHIDIETVEAEIVSI